MRSKVIALCRQHSIPVFERDFSLVDLCAADEAFVTGSFGGLTSVVNLDGRSIGTGQPGALTRRLRALYLVEIERNTEVA